MSGWRIVPVEASDKQLESARDWSYVKYGKPIGNDAANGCWRCMVAAVPEPDWEALAGIVLNDDVYDQYATGGEIRRLAAALRATFGSKP